jgi:DNA-binding transcriptional MerR regulator
MAQYTIRQVAEMFRMPTSTLRYYEEEGILTNVEKNKSGQRIYTEGHLNRLRTICCFKGTGMTIAQLKSFFAYEEDEDHHIDDIVALLQERRACVKKQMEELEKDYRHVLRKLCYYSDIRTSIREGAARPDWCDYRNRIYTDFADGQIQVEGTEIKDHE